jgi:hypothetical protein
MCSLIKEERKSVLTFYLFFAICILIHKVHPELNSSFNDQSDQFKLNYE